MIPDFEYAIYVWTSYGIFAAVIAWQFLQPQLRKRRIEAEVREEKALQTGTYDDANP